jgi:putative DNA primase/helicase
MDDSLGFWSRPHVVEFPNTFAGKADTSLKDRLLEESEGILAWLIRGALDWARFGLDAPRSVFRAVEQYQDQQGALIDFAESELVRVPSATLVFAEARASYLKWTERERIRRILGPKDFGKEMRKLFGEPRDQVTRIGGKLVHARLFDGVGLRADLPPDAGGVFK